MKRININDYSNEELQVKNLENKGHDLVLIANYLVREHVKTDGKTSKL